MEWNYVRVMVVAFQCTVVVTTDLKLTMAPKYPTLGSTVSFTCSIKFTDTITDPERVQFFVNGENVATFTQKSSECNLKSVSENRYNGTCGSVPNAPLETYYSITILKPEVRDGGHFYCQLEERTMKSNSIVLKFSRYENYLVNILKTIVQNLDKLDANTTNYFVNAIEKLGQLFDINLTSTIIALSSVDSVASQLGLSKSVLHNLKNKSTTFERLVAAVDQVLLKVSLDNGTFLYTDRNLSAAVATFSRKQSNGIQFTVSRGPTPEMNKVSLLPTNNVSIIDRNVFNAVIIPPSMFTFLEENSDENITFAFTAYDDDDMLFHDLNIPKQSSTKDFSLQVNSEVIGAKILNTEIRNLIDPIIISFVHKKMNSYNPQCVYWAYEAENDSWAWFSDGCALTKEDKSFTTCACKHLTHFALLMDVYIGGNIRSDINQLGLSYISFVGCCVSMIALLMSITTYAAFSKLHQDVPSKILINLCLCLFGTNFIFVFGMKDYTFVNDSLCKIMAALLHYFLLSALMWLGVDAANMYFSLVIVFMSQIGHLMAKYMCIGWGVPLVIVITTFLHGYGDNYGLLLTNICWIKNPAFYAAFLAPVALIMLLNCLVLVLVIHQIIAVPTGALLNRSSKAKVGAQLQGSVIVIVLLGLTYMFAIFAIDQASVLFHYLFAVFNAMQGVFIFVFYCVLKKDSRYSWNSMLTSSSSKSKSSGLESGCRVNNGSRKMSQQSQSEHHTDSLKDCSKSTNSHVSEIQDS